MLGREAVVHGGDDGRDRRGEAAAQSVELGRRHGVEHEAAAVEIYNHWQLAAASGGRWNEQADAEVAGDGVVGGRNAGGIGRGARRDGAFEQGEEGAVDGAVGAEGRGV